MLAKILAQLLHTYLLHIYIYVCEYIYIYRYIYIDIVIIFTYIVPKLTMYFREFFFCHLFVLSSLHTRALYTQRAQACCTGIGSWAGTRRRTTNHHACTGIGDASWFSLLFPAGTEHIGHIQLSKHCHHKHFTQNKTHLLPNPTPNLSTFKQKGLIHAIAPALSLSAVRIEPRHQKKLDPGPNSLGLSQLAFIF